MSQHDYDIADQPGSSFRADLNNALGAIVSQNSGTSAPSTTYAYMLWADTTNNVLKQRNAADSAWIILYDLANPLQKHSNRLINGNFQISQRGTSFDSTTTPANSDDTYLLDRWYLLSDGNDIVDVTQQSDGAVGDLNYIRLDVETVSKKFGIAQIIERSTIADLIGGSSKVSLSFNAKVNSASAGRLDNIKAGIITWSGTADSVTSDIISAWNAEDTDPTLIANATFENTPANLSVTTSDARYKIENIAIDTASAANLIALIWSDGFTGTLGDTLEISNVQLEAGSVATDYEHRNPVSELQLCQRYFCRVGSGWHGSGEDSGAQIGVTGQFPVEMRAVPTASLNTTGVGTITIWNHTISAGTTNSGTSSFTNSSPLSTKNGSVFSIGGWTGAWTNVSLRTNCVDFSAEL